MITASRVDTTNSLAVFPIVCRVIFCSLFVWENGRWHCSLQFLWDCSKTNAVVFRYQIHDSLCRHYRSKFLHLLSRRIPVKRQRKFNCSILCIPFSTQLASFQQTFGSVKLDGFQVWLCWQNLTNDLCLSNFAFMLLQLFQTYYKESTCSLWL